MLRTHIIGMEASGRIERQSNRKFCYKTCRKFSWQAIKADCLGNGARYAHTYSYGRHTQLSWKFGTCLSSMKICRLVYCFDDDREGLFECAAM